MDTDTLVTTSHIAGAMNYPSTTQALFALIVMIIVLLFILVYCCWGTFSCTRQDEHQQAEEGAAGGQRVGQELASGQMVIVPFSNMLYVGDPESRRIYQIQLDQDKPPAYSEMFTAGPPPPYSQSGTAPPASVESSAGDDEANTLLSDLPPPYEFCLSHHAGDKSLVSASRSTLDSKEDQEVSGQTNDSPQPTQPTEGPTATSSHNPLTTGQSEEPLGASEHNESAAATHTGPSDGVILSPALLTPPQDAPTLPAQNHTRHT